MRIGGIPASREKFSFTPRDELSHRRLVAALCSWSSRAACMISRVDLLLSQGRPAAVWWVVGLAKNLTDPQSQNGANDR